MRIARENVLLNLTITLDFLAALTRYRLSVHLGGEDTMPEVPNLVDDNHAFTRLVLDHDMTVDEYCILAIGLIPHIIPTFFDELVAEYLPVGQKDFKRLGGYRSTHIRTFLPTGETVLFLLAGDDLERRFQVQKLFASEHYFSKKRFFLWRKYPLKNL